MKKARWEVAIWAVVTMCVAGHAGASTFVYSWSVSGPYADKYNTVERPFGLTDASTLAGSVTIDDTLSGAAAFTALTYTTGTMTWLLSDIHAASSLTYDYLGRFQGISLLLYRYDGDTYVGQSLVVTYGPLLVEEQISRFESKTLSCSACIAATDSVADNDVFPRPPSTSIPEPSTWIVLVMGLVGLGSLARRQRASLAPVEA